jgi:hypothetical protein
LAAGTTAIREGSRFDAYRDAGRQGSAWIMTIIHQNRET